MMKSNIRLLLVDDNEVNSLMAGFLLNKIGISFDIASTKTRALELIAENDYSLIILDIEMPDNESFDVAEEARRINPKVPIVAFTTLPEKDVKPKALDSGMNEYILKHAAMRHLTDIVEKYKMTA